MKLRFEELTSHLKRSLLPVYLVSGDEPVLVDEAFKQIIHVAQQRGFDEINSSTAETGFNWEEWLISLSNHSLFSTRQLQIMYLNTGKPGDKGSLALQRYCEHSDDSQLLIIIAPKLDAAALKTKWCQAIDKAGAVLSIWPLEAAARKNWFITRMKQADRQIEPDALDWIIHQNTGNLLALRQLIEQFKLLFQAGTLIKLADLFDIVTDQSEFDIFKLTDSCDVGDAKSCIRIMQKLHSKRIEPILVIWALTRELRFLHDIQGKLEAGNSLDSSLRDLRILPRRKQMVERALKRLKQNDIYHLLEQASRIDAAIKGANQVPVWPALQRWCLSYCGALPIPYDRGDP